MLDLTGRGLLMKASEYQFAQEILTIQFRYADAVKEIKANESLSFADKEAALLRLKALTESEFDVAKQRLKLAEKMQNATFGEGFFVAMIQSARNATTAFQYGQQAFESMMGNMGAALNQFVQTGKLSFKDLAKSIIQDLIAIQLRAQATALFSRMIGGMYSGGATVGPGMAAEALPAGFNQYLAARAEGGPVSGNSPYLVGERGPELFVPNRSGTIVPTNQLAGAMGGGQTVNYNGPFIQQMSAIDTQSAIQFLAQNKQAVWAANQSAQRSLPMSR
jgi:phage-related minor tail protein